MLCRGVLAGLCTEEWRQDRLQGGYPSSALDRYCSVNSPVHYHLTDLGLFLLLRLLPVPFLVVTNADNYYSPQFASTALGLLQEGDKDLVLVDMLNRGQVLQVAAELGRMDLGCAVIRSSALLAGGKEKTGRLTFSAALPSPAAPEHWHDAGEHSTAQHFY